MTGFVIEQEVIVPSGEGRDRERWITAVHEAGHAVAALGDVGADALGLAEPAAPDFSLEGTQNGTE